MSAEAEDAVPELWRRWAGPVDIAPQSADVAARTVEVVWSTGAKVRQRGRRPDGSSGEWLEELDLGGARLDRLNAGAPVLDTHQADVLARVVGAVVPGTARIEGGRGVAVIRFSERPSVEALWKDVLAGVIRSVSIGYRVERYERETAGDVPVWRAVVWEPWEISLVPVPADAGARIRSVEAIADGTECGVVETASITVGMTSMSDTPDQKVVAAAEAEVDSVRATASEATATSAEERVLQERKRVSALVDLGQRFGEQELAMRSVADGTPVEVFRAQLLERLAERRPAAMIDAVSRPSVQVMVDEREKMREGMVAYLRLRSGGAVGDDEKLDAGEFRGLTLLELARHCAERTGIRSRGVDVMTMLGDLFLQRRDGAPQGTGDFPIILENTMHKSLLASYRIQPVTWKRFCATGTVSDFRPHPRYRTGFLSRLQPVLENAEFQWTAIPDGKKEIAQAITKGIMFGISRQTIINDEMDTFKRIPREAAYMVALSVEMDVFDLLASNSAAGPTMNEDGLALFHSSHGNIGTAGAPSRATFDEASVKMASQRSPAGHPFLANVPKVWVGPIALRSAAWTINASETDVGQNNPAVKNPVQGMLSDIVASGFLTGTRWYMFADPAMDAALEVAFLNNQQDPALEAREGWTIDGVQWRVRLDYGVAAMDWRFAFTNAGA